MRIRSGYFIMNLVILGYCWWSRCKFSLSLSIHEYGILKLYNWILSIVWAFIEVIWCHWDHQRIFFISLISHDWKELETRARAHCAYLVTTHRIIFNMTYVGQYVISRDLDLRSNIELTVQSHHCMLQRSLTRGSRCWLNNFASFLSSKVICQKLFCQKQLF